MFWSFVIIFCICEFGEQLTQQFQVFDDALCKFKWYLMPTEMQRMLVIVMSNTQQASFMYGYGNIECTRDSFKQVRSTIWQYSNGIISFNFFPVWPLDRTFCIFLFHDAATSEWINESSWWPISQKLNSKRMVLVGRIFKAKL